MYVYFDIQTGDYVIDLPQPEAARLDKYLADNKLTLKDLLNKILLAGLQALNIVDYHLKETTDNAKKHKKTNIRTGGFSEE